MDADTPITMSLGNIISGAIAYAGVLILGAWGVFSLTLGGVYDDLSDIKGRLSTTQTVVGDVQGEAMDADTEIRQSLSSIDKNVAVMASDFSSFKGSIEKGLEGVQT